jgi:PST family polysaccharide transporter
MSISNITRNVKTNKVASNVVFLLITQGINYLFPLISIKYLINILGVEVFGKVSFAQSFIGYFIVLVDYGFNISATKQVALKRDSPKELSVIFYNTFFAKIILLLFSMVVFVTCILCIKKLGQDPILYASFFGVVIGWMLFPQWYFQGIEKMGYVTLINLIIKVLFLGAIFIIVKSSDDYKWVPVLYSISYIIPGIYGFIIAAKKCGKVIHVKGKEILETLKDGFSVFLSSAMGTLLSGSAVFILGFLASDALVGYFAGFDKLIKAGIMIFAPITLSVYPTVARKFVSSQEEGLFYIKKIAIPTISFAICVAVGIVIFSDQIINLFYSPDFGRYKIILNILAAWMVVSVANNFIGIQYLTGSGKTKLYGKSFAIAGVLSLLLILLLTDYFSYTGTALAVLFGEIILSIVMLTFIYFDARNEKNPHSIRHKARSY